MPGFLTVLSTDFWEISDFITVIINLATILNVFTAICLVFCEVAHGASASPNPVSATGFEPLPELRSAALTELSGLAVSRRDPRLVWAVNDSGNAASLVALNAQAEVVGVVPVQDGYNHDWEDLASFELDGRPWLLIADTGDNFSLRAEVALILVPEPQRTDRSVLPERLIRFRYEDGPRDCEAVAVDATRRRVLLADKGRDPAGLYELPLEGEAGVRIARRIGELPELVPTSPPRVPTLGGVRGRGTPTAMSLSADGRRLAVLTYLSLTLFERGADEDWPAALRRPPLRSERLPRRPLFEALALSSDGRSALAGTEGERAFLYRWTP